MNILNWYVLRVAPHVLNHIQALTKVYIRDSCAHCSHITSVPSHNCAFVSTGTKYPLYSKKNTKLLKTMVIVGIFKYRTPTIKHNVTG